MKTDNDDYVIVGAGSAGCVLTARPQTGASGGPRLQRAEHCARPWLLLKPGTDTPKLTSNNGSDTGNAVLTRQPPCLG